MAELYPLIFEPRLKERVWGGRTLAMLYDKRLPPDVPIGESWEVSDRPGDESTIANGPLAGRSLRWLMETQASAVLGGAQAPGGRFPILCKILDARERLSLQVHPPPSQAHLGEPKTELWYIAAADPGAELFVGLQPGVTRAAFEARIQDGTVAECFHRIPVRAGDAMFLPSGRVHAIGAGLVIFEIQQNSDTTFRVFDWNRRGLDGAPRELHVAESLASIDFADVAPGLVPEAAQATATGTHSIRPLVRHALFDVDLVRVQDEGAMPLPPRLRLIAAVEQRVTVAGGGVAEALAPGQFALLPASLSEVTIAGPPGAVWLVVEPGGV